MDSSNTIAAGGGATHSGSATPGSASASSTASSLPASCSVIFCSGEAFVNHKSPNFKFAKSLVDFLDRNHKQGHASVLRTFVKTSCLSMPLLTPVIYGTNGFYLLVKDQKVVAVAQLDSATTITTITVPKAERGKGYARMLLRFIAEFYGNADICIFSPTYLTHERLLNSAGWTRFDDTLCPGGEEVDTMPEHSKVRYAEAMKREDKAIYDESEGIPADLQRLIRLNRKISGVCDKLVVPKK